MSHIVINKYTVCCIDCIWEKGKNLQKINTIEIFFGVSTDSYFLINYNFHKIDFDIWKEIVEEHKEDNEDAILTDENNHVIKNLEDLENKKEYYEFNLKSKNFNLYRNINLIFFLKKDTWNNGDKMLKQNTWTKNRSSLFKEMK